MLPDWFLISICVYFVLIIVLRIQEVSDTREWTHIKREESIWYIRRFKAEIKYWEERDAKEPSSPAPASPDKAG